MDGADDGGKHSGRDKHVAFRREMNAVGTIWAPAVSATPGRLVKRSATNNKSLLREIVPSPILG
jgi:hypothetical protein